MIRDHQVIDVLEDQGTFRRIFVLSLQEADRVVSPMSTGIQVVRCVVSIIKTEAITLSINQIVPREKEILVHTATSIRVTLDLKSESGSISSTKAC